MKNNCSHAWLIQFWFFKKAFHFTISFKNKKAKIGHFKEMMHNHGSSALEHWAHRLNILSTFSRDIQGAGETNTLIKIVFWSQVTWGFFWKFNVVEMYNGTVLLAQMLLRITIVSVIPLYFKLEEVRPVCHAGKLWNVSSLPKESIWNNPLSWFWRIHTAGLASGCSEGQNASWVTAWVRTTKQFP